MSDTLAISILIPAQSAGRVIGKAGAGLKQIRELSGCNLKVHQQEDDGHRLADLTGPSANQFGQAFQLIAERCFPAGQPLPDDTATLTIVVPNSYVGGIVGRGGENLKRIRAETRVQVTVEREQHRTEDGEEERIARVSGAETRLFGRALQMALATVLRGPERGQDRPEVGPPITSFSARKQPTPMPAPYVPVQQAPRSMPRQPPQAAAPSISQVRPHSGRTDELQIHMVIPGKFIGAILGKEGSQIKEIAAESGCRSVTATKREPISTERRIIVIGGHSPCAVAQRSIYGHYVTAAGAVNEEVTEITVIYMVACDVAGAVIGKGGDNLKRIREESGAKVNLQREIVEDFRPCMITGKFEDVLLAENLIYEQIQSSNEVHVESKPMKRRREDQDESINLQSPVFDSQPYDPFEPEAEVVEVKRPRTNSSDPSTKMLVPGKCAGAVIGKAGGNVKNIRESCGVGLDFAKEGAVPQWPNDRVVTIKGSLEARLSAVAAVLKSAFPPEEQRDALLKLLIPASEAGSVIGRAGNTLKDIRERSGVNCRVEKQEVLGERLVTAEGPMDGVLTAAELFLDAIDAGKGGPPGNSNMGGASSGKLV